MRFDLSQCRWQLKGYYPWVPFKDTSMETGKELQGITDWIDATVPGGVHLDLFRAGLIPYPYHDLDSLCCEWVEQRWWLYRTFIETERLPQGERLLLTFDGLDYDAYIYLCGQQLCRHVGMYERVELDITQLAATHRQMELRVLFRHAPDEMGQIGKTSETTTQKSRFNYKWDFSTRLVNLGIWEDCYIQAVRQGRLTEPYVATTVAGGVGQVDVSAQLDSACDPGDFSARCTLSGHGITQTIPMQLEGRQLACGFSVESPRLWYPNGYGQQPLYDLSIALFYRGEPCYEHTMQVGIRSLAYRQNQDSPADAFPYTFVVNGQPIYVKGVNMTPLDHVYGAVTADHYRQMVLSMKQMNVNLVRVWGGGLIEKDCFYRLCSQHGILVWQEFIQSSSGIDNVPSQKPGFLELLKRSATHAITHRRSYTCLAVWSGGNELTDANYRPAGCNDPNLAMLQGLVEQLDPQRLFLPTSASGPREFISYDKGVSHDIHGHWNYCGNPEHYRLYGQSDSLFHSEFGTEGMCSARSLQKFVSPRYRTLQSSKENICYRHHGDWWCTFERDEAIFGPRRSIDELSRCSQWLQAEGLRYILECNRRRKFKNSGSIIWQINEPWPNVYCTSLMDYYMEPKMAYYWSQTAFADFGVSLAYDKLDYRPGEALTGTIYLHKDAPAPQALCILTAQLFTQEGTLVYSQDYTARLSADCAVPVDQLAMPMPAQYQGLLVLRLWASYDGKTVENSYFFGCDSVPVYQTALSLPGVSPTILSTTTPVDGRFSCTVANLSNTPALHVYPVDLNDSVHLLADTAYFTLMPGESRTVSLLCQPKFSSGLLPTPSADMADLRLAWQCFNC